jgi:feruloyl esterase
VLLKIFAGGLCAVLCVAVIDSQPFDAAASCEKLASLTLPNATITRAQAVEAGALTPPTPPNGTPPPAAVQAFSNLPAFCRVAATLKPSSDSDIKIEVWMPASGWNGKFEAVGNGGWAGNISYPALASALRHGYATASTDTGHSGDGGGASFALNHPEKLIDFGYRAVHEMTVQAKTVVAAFYGHPQRLSYWNGCSTGGKQGLTEAQRFPEDYDGIVAGAPANFWTHLMASGLWIAHATLKDPASHIPSGKFALIHRAALEACDALDGVKDGLLADPTRCSFDPKVLQCVDQEAPTCLTAPQVEAARKIYAGPMNPLTRQQIFPGLERGSEPGWGAMAGGPKPFSITADHFRYVVFKNPEWDFRALDFDRDVALADQLDNGTLNATDPNLTKFRARGGRLLLYHGWNDQLIAPQNTINYYKSVVAALGGPARTQESVRLFMAPGMGHCSGGEGPSRFDMMSEIEQWVEQRHAPDQIVASQRKNDGTDRTRPLCPYPQVARYKGTGSIDDAESFVCAMP